MDTLSGYGVDERVLAEASLCPDWHLARVVSQSKDVYRMRTKEGEILAEVSGKFRHEAACPADYPGVGDFVMTDRAKDGAGHAVIHRVLTRKSVFARAVAGGGRYTQVVAANIDIVFLCMALNSDYNLSRLERYLAVAWDSRAVPVVVLTKADLCADLPGALAEVASIAPGVDIVAVSEEDPASRERLFAYLAPGVTASFIGSSGVGKSTLINRLAGEERLATAATRQDGRGRHTSTRRELLMLPSGGIVIDTPGMRELGVASADLDRSFADIDDLTVQCRFHDCSHSGEPGCAVELALQTGALDARRWENYRKLEREARYEGLSAKQIETEKLNGMFSAVGGMKKARQYLRHNDKRK